MKPPHQASTSSTGLVGATFEVQVAAYYLAAMLIGERVFGPSISHQIVGINWQTGDLGWLLDDLLLDLRDGDCASSLALSAKSNHQITQAGFPEGFVNSLWSQWNQEHSSVFEKDRDYLGLVVGRLQSQVEDAWQNLLQTAIQGENRDRVARRFTRPGTSTSALSRQLFQSLHRSEGPKDPAETVDLISRLRVLHLDFRNEPSRSRQEALRMCQVALVGHDAGTARLLWARLCQLASLRNPAGGSLQSLLQELRTDFPLLAPLDQRSDWQKLKAFSQQGLNRAREFLGTDLSIPRNEARQEIETQLNERRFLLLLGESGAGKSALAKVISLQWHLGPVVWLDPIGAQVDDLLALGRKIDLRRPLAELLPLSPQQPALLVLDALDRWTSGGLDCAAQLINTCSKSTCWVILATIRSDQYRTVFHELNRRGITTASWSTHSLQLPSTEDLREVWRKFPELLRSIHEYPSLAEIFRNLKVLDWLSGQLNLQRTDESDPLGNPSQLIDALWKQWTGLGPNRHRRAAALQQLARLEADQMEPSIVLSLLEGHEGVLAELENEELIRIEEGRASFRHDMAGDWARLQILVAESRGPLRQKLQGLALSPRWYSALCLYGQRMLEQRVSGVQDWLGLYQALGSELDSAAVAQDLLFDSLIFSYEAETFLESLWPQLISGGGLFLERLLKRFLFIATEPDPRIDELAESQATVARAIWRVPDWPYWGPVLRTLDRHRSDVTEKVPLLGAEISAIWLQWAPRNSRWRPEAARIALELARARLELDVEKPIVFEAVLGAAPELPDEVAALALSLSSRTPQTDKEPLEAEEDLPAYLHPRPGRLRPSFPDGPRKRICRAFREAVLGSHNLDGLIAIRPEIAREVLLACCLEEPRWESPGDEDYWHDVPGVYDWMEAFPPMYFKGPFLQFLRLNPKEGLEVILRLVNQAAINWETRGRKRRHDSLVIHRRKWLGGEEVYRWHQNAPSHILLASLTALEKWLYDEIDQGRSIQSTIETILRRSRSVAFAGLLVVIGKKSPWLFEGGSLFFMLGLWKLYRWDQHATREHGGRTIGWMGSPQPVLQRVQEWFDLPHRRVQIGEISLPLIFPNSPLRVTFAKYREAWAKQLKSARFVDQDEIQRLISCFNPENYQYRHRDDGAIEILSFEWPESIRSDNQRLRANHMPVITAANFAFECRQRLDSQELLTIEQAEALWGELLAIRKTKDLLREDQYADALAAGIAALVLLPGDWAKDHPDQKDECKRQFLELFESIPSEDVFGRSSELIKEHWPGFGAETVVALLAEDRSDPELRKLAAMAVMSEWHEAETTEIAMNRGFQERHRLGEDWGRMQNLATLWASLLSMAYRSRFREDSLLRRWAFRLRQWFVREQLSSHPLDWKKISRVTLSLRSRFHRKEVETLEDEFAHPHFHPAGSTATGFKRDDLKAAFSWLPDLKHASNNQEQESWLELHRHLLGLAMDSSLSSSHYTSWIFRRIGALIPRLETQKERRSFWEPLFSPETLDRDLGGSFLMAWFDAGPSAAESPDFFVQCWDEMIRYAVALEEDGPGKTVDWDLLMGLYWNGSAEYRDSVGRLLPLYRSWAAKHLNGGRTVKQLSRFLVTPAARDLLPDGILWLSKSLPSFRESHERGLDEAVVELVRTGWPDPSLRKPLQELLAWVTRRATPTALALQEEIRG